MNIEELKEYNRLVIDASKEVAKPWKWTTLILAFLLAGMVALYFLCPADYIIKQDNTNAVDSVNYKG